MNYITLAGSGFTATVPNASMASRPYRIPLRHRHDYHHVERDDLDHDLDVADDERGLGTPGSRPGRPSPAVRTPGL